MRKVQKEEALELDNMYNESDDHYGTASNASIWYN